MEEINYKVNRVFYFEVNGKKIYNEEEARDYALKLFVTDEVSKIWKKNPYMKEYSIYMDKDDKTIIVYIYSEPIIDDWNVGHYGCTSPTIIDKSKTKKYKTIKDLYRIYTSEIDEILSIDDTINIERLRPLCTDEVINNMINYKDMLRQLREKIKK